MRAKQLTKTQKWILALAACLVAVAIFVWRYTAVNAAFPPAVVQQYQLNEPVLHNGIEYTLSDFKIMGEDEFCEEYDINPVHVKSVGLNSKIILVTMYAKNVTDQNVEVDFAGQMLLQQGNYQCSYLCYMPLFQRLEPDKPLAGVMLPGHDIEMLIPYQFNEYEWSKTEFANLENETMQMVFSIYPVKKTILLTEKTA